MRFFCVGFRCENDVAICINLYLRGCIIHFRKYGLPYGLSVSLCTLHLMVTHFNATLGMGGWLDLTQQGLSPCKKYKTSWRSFAKSYRNIDLVHLPYLNFKEHRFSRCFQLSVDNNILKHYRYQNNNRQLHTRLR